MDPSEGKQEELDSSQENLPPTQEKIQTPPPTTTTQEKGLAKSTYYECPDEETVHAITEEDEELHVLEEDPSKPFNYLNDARELFYDHLSEFYERGLQTYLRTKDLMGKTHKEIFEYILNEIERRGLIKIIRVTSKKYSLNESTSTSGKIDI